MNDDLGKKALHLFCAVVILVGIGFIWHWIRKERFRSPEEHETVDGAYFTGGWTTLAQGIVMLIGGFVILFAFG